MATHLHRDEDDGGLGGEEGASEIVVGADGNAQVKPAQQSIFSGVQILDNYDGSDDHSGNDSTAGKEVQSLAAAEAASSAPTSSPSAPATPEDDDSSSDDGYDDLSAFEDMSLVQEQDPAALPAKEQSVAAASASNGATTSGGESKSGGVVRVSEPAGAVVQCRRYDISITYDKYYQTPRVWLLGYDERGQPLNQEQIFEDIMQDYANKTVTIERHPLAERNSSSVHASIHPCKHASTMKKIIDRLNDDGAGGARVDMYLIIFLKFIQSVVPTMNYDFTAEANIG